MVRTSCDEMCDEILVKRHLKRIREELATQFVRSHRQRPLPRLSTYDIDKGRSSASSASGEFPGAFTPTSLLQSPSFRGRADSGFGATGRSVGSAATYAAFSSTTSGVSVTHPGSRGGKRVISGSTRATVPVPDRFGPHTSLVFS